MNADFPTGRAGAVSRREVLTGLAMLSAAGVGVAKRPDKKMDFLGDAKIEKIIPDRIASTVASARACEEATTATAAPAAPNCWAMARPTARPAPVTKATLSTKARAGLRLPCMLVGVRTAPVSYVPRSGSSEAVRPAPRSAHK